MRLVTYLGDIDLANRRTDMVLLFLSVPLLFYFQIKIKKKILFNLTKPPEARVKISCKNECSKLIESQKETPRMLHDVVTCMPFHFTNSS